MRSLSKLCVLSVLLTLGGSGAGYAQAVFYSNSAPSVQASSGAVAADFNQDGAPDLATIVAGPTGAFDTIAIEFGKGDGTFIAGPSVSVGSVITSFAAGDLNGDGQPDLVVSSSAAQQLLIFLNIGGGNFATPLPIAIPGVPASQYGAVQIADFNKDGARDVLLGTSLLWFGDGKGNLNGPLTILPNSPNGQALIGDFNADGYLDVAVTYPYSPQVSLYLGSALGVFSQFGNAFIIPASFQPALFAVGDFNGDGKSDLVMVNSRTSQVEILLSTTSGALNTLAPFYASTPGNISGVAVADLNGDGHADLILLNGEVSVLLGKGDGTFGPRNDFYESINFSSAQPSLPMPPLVIADFNADQKPDLFLYSSGETQLLLSSPVSPLMIVNNPIFAGFGTLGQTTLAWNAAPNSQVQIVVGSPTGTPLTGVEGSTGFAITRQWVYDGLPFYLIDLSTGTVIGTAIAHVVPGLSPLQLPASLTATPIVIPSGLSGTTTLSWTADPTRYPSVYVTVGSPTGTPLTGPSGPSGTAQAGPWASDGIPFFLIDASTGSVIASTVAYASSQTNVPTMLSATPNPAPGNANGLAQVTISWETSRATQTVITVGSPGGPVLTSGGPQGAAETAFWVYNGLQFFLQDVSGGKPLIASNTLASVTVQVTTATVPH